MSRVWEGLAFEIAALVQAHIFEGSDDGVPDRVESLVKGLVKHRRQPWIGGVGTDAVSSEAPG